MNMRRMRKCMYIKPIINEEDDNDYDHIEYYHERGLNRNNRKERNIYK